MNRTLKIFFFQLLALYCIKISCSGNQPSNISAKQRDSHFTINKIHEKRISEIKCEEYELMTRQLKTSEQCDHCVLFLMANGQYVRKNEFPHMAAIGWIRDKNSSSIEYSCAGSLISEQWVLTSAHCTHNDMGFPRFVKLGSNDLSNDSGEMIKIMNIIIHPEFNQPRLYHDIALLKLERAVEFKNNVKPACLYKKFETAPDSVWATGWGSRRNDTYDPSNELMKVKLQTIDNIRCSMAYGKTIAVPNGVSPSMICAGDTFNHWKSDTCQGDSGGPIQVFRYRNFDNSSLLFDIVGITSFGRSCATENIPGIYIRVSHYIDWIEKIVWLNS